MARVGFEAALTALKSGDRIMVTLADPTKLSDRTRYNLLGGGCSNGDHVRAAERSYRAGARWTVPRRSAVADLSAGGAVIDP
jgi:hypothetical protein